MGHEQRIAFMLYHAQGGVNRKGTGQIPKNAELPNLTDRRYLPTLPQTSTEVMYSIAYFL